MIDMIDPDEYDDLMRQMQEDEQQIWELKLHNLRTALNDVLDAGLCDQWATISFKIAIEEIDFLEGKKPRGSMT